MKKPEAFSVFSKIYQNIKFVEYGDTETSGRVKLDRNKMLSEPTIDITEEKERECEHLFNDLRINLNYFTCRMIN